MADTNNSKAIPTLRKAQLVPKGGTGPAELNRPASDSARAALASRIFGGSGTHSAVVGLARRGRHLRKAHEVE